MTDTKARTITGCMIVAMMCLTAAAAAAQPYRVDVACSGDCTPAWNRGYWFTIQATSPRELIGLTLKARNTEAAPPGCMGRPSSARAPWPTPGGRAECRASLPLDSVSQISWRSPACSEDVRVRVKFNAKAEWANERWPFIQAWANTYIDFGKAPDCSPPSGRGGRGGGGSGSGYSGATVSLECGPATCEAVWGGGTPPAGQWVVELVATVRGVSLQQARGMVLRWSMDGVGRISSEADPVVDTLQIVNAWHAVRPVRPGATSYLPVYGSATTTVTLPNGASASVRVSRS